ncbi:hypothetical protein KBC99_02140 [Candidatus Saccharibacteria bacterium]|nr:hypothetical protein [Candidatus Saccharibacteria bacterium]
MQILSRLLTALVLTAVLALAVSPAPALAADCNTINGIANGAECGNTGRGPTLTGGIKTAVNTMLFVLGIASVIVIIVAGYQYVFSAGNPQSTARAKDTILYAVIGLVVAILAYAIVNFVIGQFA